jgi:hypothetical protein
LTGVGGSWQLGQDPQLLIGEVDDVPARIDVDGEISGVVGRLGTLCGCGWMGIGTGGVGSIRSGSPIIWSEWV